MTRNTASVTHNPGHAPRGQACTPPTPTRRAPVRPHGLGNPHRRRGTLGPWAHGRRIYHRTPTRSHAHIPVNGPASRTRSSMRRASCGLVAKGVSGASPTACSRAGSSVQAAGRYSSRSSSVGKAGRTSWPCPLRSRHASGPVVPACVSLRWRSLLGSEALATGRGLDQGPVHADVLVQQQPFPVGCPHHLVEQGPARVMCRQPQPVPSEDGGIEAALHQVHVQEPATGQVVCEFLAAGALAAHRAQGHQQRRLGSRFGGTEARPTWAYCGRTPARVVPGPQRPLP